MADIYVNKDISILTQVALKAFIEAYKRLPHDDKDWEIINKLTVEIWSNSRKNVESIGNLTEPKVEPKLNPEEASLFKMEHQHSDINVKDIPF